MKAADCKASHKVQDVSPPTTVKTKKILAVCSGGGHWEQMKLLRPAFRDYPIVYVTEQRYENECSEGAFYSIKNASRWEKNRIMILMFQILFIVLKEKPKIVISTGAAPGFFAVLFGKVFSHAKAIWLDSLANCLSISLSGRLARPFVDLMLTQHVNLIRPNGPHYEGRLI